MALIFRFNWIHGMHYMNEYHMVLCFPVIFDFFHCYRHFKTIYYIYHDFNQIRSFDFASKFACLKYLLEMPQNFSIDVIHLQSQCQLILPPFECFIECQYPFSSGMQCDKVKLIRNHQEDSPWWWSQL